MTTSLLSGIGRIYEDWLAVPLARRKAEAHLISSNAEADAEVARAIKLAAAVAEIRTIEGRARIQYLDDATRQQANLENVAKYALEEVRSRELRGDICEDPHLDVDWVEEFRELAKKANKEELQRLLGKIITGESSSPGSYPISVVFKLKTLDVETLRDFENFAKLYVPSFGVVRTFNLAGGENAEARRLGISFHKLVMCASEGLMSDQLDLSSTATDLEPSIAEINGRKYEIRALSVGRAVPVLVFTKVGVKIAELMSKPSDEKYFSEAFEVFRRNGFSVTDLEAP